MNKFYKLIYFVPESHLELTKQAVFATGAGQLGHYDRCAWQVLGDGQFRPLSGANPHIGAVGAVEQVSEYRVEILVAEDNVMNAIHALKKAHPYEEPAYEMVALVPLEHFSAPE